MIKCKTVSQILVILFFPLFLFSQDTIHPEKRQKKTLGGTILKVSDSLWWRIYNPEQGYFQKANFDKSDPRFMIANENQTFKFGIGGFVRVVAFADFAGSIDNNDFVTSLIAVPYQNSAQFNIFPDYSRLNVKVVGKIKNKNIVVFTEGDFNSKAHYFRLRHAYVSFIGLTIGQTWSTFMDLEASPETVDGEGPNNQIALRLPMIRYTYYYKDKFQFAIAAEMTQTLMREIPEHPFKIYSQKKRVPNFVTHFKYKGNFGHVQLGAILTTMNYGDSSTLAPTTHFALGGGVSLSGTFKLWKNAKLFHQINGGKGIGYYIQDLSFFKYDLVPTFTSNTKMKTVWMYGGYLGLQQNWTKKLSSNFVYGLTRLQTPHNEDKLYDAFYGDYYYKYGHYVAINTFWNFYDFATLGVEYLFGEKINLSGVKGHANRINILLQYAF